MICVMARYRMTSMCCFVDLWMVCWWEVVAFSENQASYCWCCRAAGGAAAWGLPSCAECTRSVAVRCNMCVMTEVVGVQGGARWCKVAQGAGVGRVWWGVAGIRGVWSGVVGGGVWVVVVVVGAGVWWVVICRMRWWSVSLICSNLPQHNIMK